MFKTEEERRKALTKFIVENTLGIPEHEARLAVDLASSAAEQALLTLMDRLELAAPQILALTTVLALKEVAVNAQEMAKQVAETVNAAEAGKGCDEPDCVACGVRKDMMAMGGKVVFQGDGFVAIELGGDDDAGR